jgi:hypothetical protein
MGDGALYSLEKLYRIFGIMRLLLRILISILTLFLKELGRFLQEGELIRRIRAAWIFCCI